MDEETKDLEPENETTDEEIKEAEREVEEIESISTEEFETFFSTDNLQDYINIIKSFPPATCKDNIELYNRMQSGDMEARDLMINRNMRLVLGTVMRNTTPLNSCTKLDLIQAGSLGLMKAVRKFNPQKGAFSGYACAIIKRSIQREIKRFDDNIKRPEYFISKRKQYLRMSMLSEENGETLSDRETKEELHVSDETLALIKTDSLLDTKSLDEVITEKTNGDPVTYLELIGDKEEYSEKTTRNLIDEDILAFLKTKLSSYEYYVIYHRILSPIERTLTSIGAEFGTTHEAIRQKERDIKEKIRKYYNKDGTLKIRFPFNLKDIRLTPIEPSNIALYLFVRDALSEQECIVAEELLTGNHRNYLLFLSRSLSISKQATDELIRRTIRRIKDILNTDESSFTDFKQNLISKYGSSIYDINLNSPLVHTGRINTMKPLSKAQ